MDKKNDSWLHIDGLVQEKCNSIANALELHLSCTNPSISYNDILRTSAINGIPNKYTKANNIYLLSPCMVTL